jgi:hypothetical protein
VTNDIKEQIQKNRFVLLLRGDLVVDRAEYANLCKCLKELAVAWRSESFIDKETASELYGMYNTVFAAGEFLEKSDPEIGQEVQEMAIEIDGLISDCFFLERTPDQLNERLRLWDS